MQSGIFQKFLIGRIPEYKKIREVFCMKKLQHCKSRVMAVILAAAMGMTAMPQMAYAQNVSQNEDLSDTQAASAVAGETAELSDESSSLEEARCIWMDQAKSTDERVEALLGQMTLDEKVAQMVQPEQKM